MAKEAIDTIVKEQAFQQVEKLVDVLNKAKISLADNVAEAIRLNNALGQSRGMRDFTRSNNQAADAIERVRTSQERSRLEEIRLETARRNAFDRYERQLARQEAAQARANARAAEAARPYNLLAASLRDAEKEALDLGAAFGANSTQFRDATRRVQELRTQVDALEQPVGRFQRNVGNYASGFNGLGNSINQLTREFPAFTYSVQTGFLALSNNLPIFFDEIQRTQAGIRAMRAEGQQVPGLLAQLARSFFSFGTILSIGVTLLTVYGKEIGNFFASLFKGKSAMDGFIERQKTLNDVYKESNKTAGEQIATLKILYNTATDVTESIETRTKAAKALQKTYPEAFGNSKIQAILTGKESEKYAELTKAILASARAKAILSKLEAIEEERLNIDTTRKKIAIANKNEDIRAKERFKEKQNGDGLLDLNRQFSKTQLKMDLQMNADRAAAANKDLDIRKDQLDKLSKFYQEFVDSSSLVDAVTGIDKTKTTTDTSNRDRLTRELESLKFQQEAIRAIAEDEERSYDTRTDALYKFLDVSDKISAKSRDIELTETELNAHQKGLIEDNFERDKIRNQQEFSKIGLEILNQSFDEETKARNIAAQKKIDDLKAEETFRLQVLKDAYSNGTISEQQLGELRLEIQRDYAQRIISQEIENVKELILLGKLSVDDRADAEKKLAELKLKYAELGAKGQKEISDKSTKTEIDNAQKVADAKRQLQEELVNLAGTFVERGFQNQEDEVKSQIEAIDRRESAEKEAVNRSLDTEIAKREKLAIIEARAQNQREQLEARQRQIQLKRAQFEKASAIAGIIANTALAVSKTLGQTGFLGIPLAAIVAGIGAVQLATALATPIPKFEKGGKMPYTGLAEYGHGTELRIDPDGKISLTKSTPEVGVVKKGTNFISNKDLVQMIAKPDMRSYVAGQQVDVSNIERELRMTRKEMKALLTQKSTSKPGLNHYNSTGTNWNKYLRQNIN